MISKFIYPDIAAEDQLPPAPCQCIQRSSFFLYRWIYRGYCWNIADKRCGGVLYHFTRDKVCVLLLFRITFKIISGRYCSQSKRACVLLLLCHVFIDLFGELSCAADDQQPGNEGIKLYPACFFFWCVNCFEYFLMISNGVQCTGLSINSTFTFFVKHLTASSAYLQQACVAAEVPPVHFFFLMLEIRSLSCRFFAKVDIKSELKSALQASDRLACFEVWFVWDRWWFSGEVVSMVSCICSSFTMSFLSNTNFRHSFLRKHLPGVACTTANFTNSYFQKYNCKQVMFGNGTKVTDLSRRSPLSDSKCSD